MSETIIVVGIVAVPAVLAGRSFYRALAGKNDGCGCAGTRHRCGRRVFAQTDQGQDADK
ncbi:MAG: FeoB-associated Cys-rich membrane protein [Deltaproteobacteria bacterium]|nr:FeoB-associated Cys-rich membrane protein [Deltaproteobacteria bacterium]